MPETSANIRAAFQPLINLHTGDVVAMEMLARPAHHDVRSLLRHAAATGGLEKLDVRLAVAAAHCSAEHETLLPLHLNLTADTVVTEAETLAPLHRALIGTGRQPSQTVLEINPSEITVRPELLLAGLHRLRGLGYRIALDGVGAGNYPLLVIAAVRPDLIKMDREIVERLPRDGGSVAFLLAVSGAYGHALYARREAGQLGDKPQVLESGDSTRAALELICSSVAAGDGRGPARRLPDAGPAASAREVDAHHQLGVSGRAGSKHVDVMFGQSAAELRTG